MPCYRLTVYKNKIEMKTIPKEACKSRWVITDGNERSVSHRTRSFYIYAGFAKLSLTAVVEAAAADWCAVTAISSMGEFIYEYDAYSILEITVTVQANLTVEQRIAHITISDDGRSEAVIITQDAGNATLSVDHTMIELGYTASTYTIPVTSNASWTATGDPAMSICCVKE
jgi:hypothetical protein